MTTFSDAKLVIIQPRVYPEPQVWDVSVDDLRSIGHELGVLARKALDPDAPRVPSEKACQWCAHRESCEERKEYVHSRVTTIIDPLARVLEKGEEVDPADMDDFLDVLPLLDKVLEEMETKGWHMAKDGKLARHKTVAGKNLARRYRKDIDEAELMKKAARWRGLEGKHLGLDAVAPRKLKSPTQLRAMLSDKAKAKLEEYLQPAAKGKDIIVPIEDPRPSTSTKVMLGATEPVEEEDFL